ncbi:MAG: glycosyltransferase family 39 protein [Kiritimatiellae bacterium]|nr:glycosyltransferase family 39 protein [Kiritimatiellia bacterium]
MNPFSRTFHPDEANQAFTVGKLLETGRFVYDPSDHHGPTLYYAAAPLQKAFGHADCASLDGDLLRATPLVFAVLTLVFAALACKRLVGKALLPVLPLATLPCLFFHATDFIQEALLGCFLAAAFYFGVRYAQSTVSAGRIKPGSWAILLGVALGLAAATKETCVLSFAAAAVALAPCLRGFARPRNLSQHVVLCAVAAAVTALAFYSDFGRDFSGVRSLLEMPLAYWRRAAGSAEASVGACWHVHPWHWYFSRCFTHGNGGAAALGAAFVLLAAIRFAQRRISPAAAFVSVYAVVLLAAYSAIPYKTPWCMLTVLEAMALACGLLAFAEKRGGGTDSRATRFCMLLLAIVSAEQVLDCGVIARDPDSDKIPWNYANASPQARELAEAAGEVLRANGDGFLAVALPPENTWPFPWYNRANEKRTGYWTAFEGLEDLAKRGEKPVAVIVPAEEGHLVQPLFPHLKNTKRFEMRPKVRVRLFW